MWVRTDSLNIFEKDILPEMPIRWVSLIASELEKNLKWIKITGYSDVYTDKQETIWIQFDIDFINNLIGKKYSEKEALNILNNLWIKENDWILIIPFWRKDLNYKADIAEEIARIDWYDNVEATVPRINLWAVVQDNIYKIKNDARNYFTNKGYYDMYTYSFVSEDLMSKSLWNTKDLVPMKNALSEELSHLRWSLIPNLLLSLEKNVREYDELKLFELEKVFLRKGDDIDEFYSLAWVEVKDKDIVFYDIQNTVSDLFKTLSITNYKFDNCNDFPTFAHKWRTAAIIVRGKQIWTVWEINPKAANNFDVQSRIWYFEINVWKLKDALYSITKAHDVSNFQENNFDLNFVVNKDVKASDIKTTIWKTNGNLITKVELIDIYENEEKMAWKRSLTFKIFIQSMDWTLDDKVKSELINDIVKKVEKRWWELR